MNIRRHAFTLGILFAAVTLFYARVVFDPRTTLQWDAASYFYPYQKYFSDSVRAGHLPVWTSVLFSGFPFLADIQVGAWYPLNWPFFLAGMGPKSVFWELWLHAFLAVAGAYALCFRLLGSRRAAVFAGLFYGLSGYFSAHSQHVCLFQAAALLPWLLLFFERAVETGSRRWIAALALTGGLTALAGHFQTALYSFCAVALWGCGLTLKRPRLWPRAAGVFAALGLGSAGLAMIAILPGLELTALSLRSRLSAADWNLGIAGWRSFATFVWPNALGVFDEAYKGPADITQHYFYAGALLLPLAAIGCLEKTVRRLAPWLIIPAVLYAVGPAGLLYWLLVKLPGFSSVRAPSHCMFVATLGLALLAAAGARALLRSKWTTVTLCAVLLLDLGWWNMFHTKLVYGRGTYEQLQGPIDRWFAELVRPPLPPLQRLAAPGRWVYFFPASAPFAFPVETTFGANALMLARYYDYLVALNGNRTLMSALGVGEYFDSHEWTVHPYSPALPRFYFPQRLVLVTNETEALAALRTLDATREGIIVGGSGIVANGEGTAAVAYARPEQYRLRVESGAGGVMRIAIPWFPGWHAQIDGRAVSPFRMDHALMGLNVPAGMHQVRLWYRSTWLSLGAVVSLAALAACVCLLAWPTRRPGGSNA